MADQRNNSLPESAESTDFLLVDKEDYAAAAVSPKQRQTSNSSATPRTTSNIEEEAVIVDLEAAKPSCTMVEHDDLHRNLTDALARVALLEQEKITAATEKETLRARFNEQLKELDTLRAKTKELHVAEAELKDLRAVLAASNCAQTEVQQLRECLLRGQQEVKACTAQTITLSEQLEESKRKLATLVDENEKLSYSVTTANTQLVTVKCQLGETEKALNDLKRERAAVLAQLAKAKQDLHVMAAEREDAVNQAQTLQLIVDEAVHESLKAKEEMGNQEQLVRMMRNEFRTESDRLNRQLQTKGQELQGYMQQVSSLQKEVVELKRASVASS